MSSRCTVVAAFGDLPDPAGHAERLITAARGALQAHDAATGRAPRAHQSARVGLLVVAMLIVYGSLYPFEFRIPPAGAGPLATLLASWDAISGRGDVIANIVLYLPLGALGVLSFRSPANSVRPLLLVTVIGSMLSTALELTQFFDVGRVTSASDVYSNCFGTAAGALCASRLRRTRHIPLLSAMRDRPLPVALLAAWAASRLYPYVPTIDLHKYWHALQPLFFAPRLPIADLSRHTAIWLTVCNLVMAVIGERSQLVSLAVIAALLAGRVLIVGIVLSAPEIAGAAGALCLFPLMMALRPRLRAAILFSFLGSVVVAERLEPFEFQPFARDFGWLPFRSFLVGSLAVGVMALFEKIFLYGSLLVLGGHAGWGRNATLLTVCGAVLLSSWAQTYLPGRSAEITDAILVLLLAGGIPLLDSARPDGSPTVPPKPAT